MTEETQIAEVVTANLQSSGLPKLSGEELTLLNKNADQFRHYINKKAKRLKQQVKAQAKAQKAE